MILDSHRHVGESPMFGVAMSRDGLVSEMREHGAASGLVFHPDNGLVRSAGCPGPLRRSRAAHPDARIILGHMGHGIIFHIDAAIDMAERNPNVYLETSGMPMHARICDSVERVGLDGVLYAAGYTRSIIRRWGSPRCE